MLSTSDLVARIREKTGETQEGLAHRLGVSFPTINAWERGRSTPRPSHRKQLEDLADELGIAHDTTLLVIDDDPVTGELVAAAAADVDASITVITAGSGWEGLVQVGSLRPSVLFLDILMPGIDGLEVAKRLPEMAELADMSVVFVTSSQDERILARARSFGHSLLLKPLDIDGLSAMIRSSLGAQR